MNDTRSALHVNLITEHKAFLHQFTTACVFCAVKA